MEMRRLGFDVDQIESDTQLVLHVGMCKIIYVCGLLCDFTRSKGGFQTHN